MPNIDNIVLTDEEKNLLSSKGRFGDTEVVKIDGEWNHVNKQEKALIDKYGEKGKQLVKAIGSRTTNPDTGKKENFLPFMGTVIGWGLVGGARQYSQTGEVTASGLWDYSFGKHGLGGWLGGHEATQQARDQAANTANEAFKSTLDEAQSNLGPEGNIMETKGRELDIKQFETAQQNDQIAQQNRNQAAKQGFATLGTDAMRQQMQDLTQMGEMQSQNIISNAVQEHEAATRDLVSQKNMALSGYLDTTDETFPGSQELTDLEAYIADLNAGGTGGAV